MAIQSKSDDIEVESQEFCDDFEVRGIMLERDDESGTWEESEVTVCSRQDIKNLFSPYSVTQVDINRKLKVYTAIDNLENRAGVDGRVVSDDGRIHLLVSPIFLLECDEVEPIPVNITQETRKIFEDRLELY